MIGFIYQLRDAGIPISAQYILEFYRALKGGLAPDMDRLFLLARLIFVKRVEHYDLFEQVFGAFFLGADPAQSVARWEELLAGKPFQEWLRQEIESGRLSSKELQEFDTEELLAKFWETVLAQKEAHHGGRKWVGTGGSSPFGHSGAGGGGIRVYGRGLHGTAQKVIEKRGFVDYSDKATLTATNLGQVLTSLRSLRPTGPEAELDVDETIAKTARNAGEIEFIFRRELRNRLRLVVLLDNGGYSMMPYVSLVKTVFNKIRGLFRDVNTYYFHNCIYGTVYRDLQRTQPLKWETFLGESKSTRLLLIGDADMAPAELMAAFGSIEFYNNERRPGWEWLKELRHAFPASVWLNPIPRERWEWHSPTITQIGRLFHMEDLTLAGIKNAVEHLNVQGAAFDKVMG